MIIWLASYPRSGNTFFRIVLNSVFDIKTYSIYDDVNDIGANEKISNVVGHKFLPKNFDLKEARKSKKKYYIKTHELVTNIDLDDKDKIIYLVRDGRASSVSFAKYLTDFHNKDDNILANVIAGNTKFSFWGEHVEQWGAINKFTIKFEDLIDKPYSIAKQIAEYLNITIRNNKIPTFETLHKIDSKFFRKGQKESWSTEMTKSEEFFFWSMNFEEMDKLGYKNKMPSFPMDKALKQIIELYKKNLFDKDEQIKQRDIWLEQKNKLLQQKDNQIKHRDEWIKEKNEQIKQRDEWIKEKDNLLEQKDSIIQEKQKQFEIVKNSKIFKVGDLFFRSAKKPYKLITFPFNLIRILSK